MNYFPYYIDLSMFLLKESAQYAEYVHKTYIENKDYRINDVNINFQLEMYLDAYPKNLHKLISAHSIYFKNEEDALDFKLRFKP